LDADFIFGLNYGPMSAQDIKTMQNKLKQHQLNLYVRTLNIGNTMKELEAFGGQDAWVEQRTEMTFLDRTMGAKLHKSLYNRGRVSPGFETDWSPDREGEEPAARGVSPFDYDSYNEQTFPMLWAENFVINLVWSKNYSSSIIGSTTKPPMAAVILDMIELIKFLKSIKEPKNIVTWLTEFARTVQLHSYSPDEIIDPAWAGRGYVADLFSIVACLECTSQAPPPFPAGPDFRQAHKFPPPYYTRIIPGCGVLIPFSKPVSTAASEPSNSVDQLRAGFIHSGPFKVKATRKFEKHLTLNDRNELRVFQFWGNARTPSTKKVLVGNPSLRIYRNHALRRYATTFIP
jgi:hypothetical protein